jgi:hypothetical protein
MRPMKTDTQLLALWDELSGALHTTLEWIERGESEVVAAEAPAIRRKLREFEQALTGKPADANQRAKSIVDLDKFAQD